MEQGVLSQVGLPIAIFVIMVAMGMTLTTGDFREVVRDRKAVAVGLGCQLLVLPLLGFAIAGLFPLAPVFAVSIVLLAASPGGTTSNLIVHVAEGDRALSVSLTTLSNMFVFMLMPLYLGLAANLFGGIDGAVGVPVVQTMVQVAGLTVVPVLVGMTIRRYRPEFAHRTREFGKYFSAALLGVIILALVIQNWSAIVSDGPTFAPAFITLNLLALGAGFGIATLLGLDRRQAVTIGAETGLQNATIAIAVALSIIGSSEMAIVPGLYGVWMLGTGYAFAMLLNKQARAEVAARRALPTA